MKKVCLFFLICTLLVPNIQGHNPELWPDGNTSISDLPLYSPDIFHETSMLNRVSDKGASRKKKKSASKRKKPKRVKTSRKKSKRVKRHHGKRNRRHLSWHYQGKPDYGLCSYYHNRFHGKKTASGEIYSIHKRTAAHRTLPFGTLVKLTNAKTGQHCIVKINDRGPFHSHFLIDVSLTAAKELGFFNRQPVMVHARVISPDSVGPEPENKSEPKIDSSKILSLVHINAKQGYIYDLEKKLPKKPKGFTLQLYSLTSLEKVKSECSQLFNDSLKSVFVVPIRKKRRLSYKVLYGQYLSRKEALVFKDFFIKRGQSPVVKKFSAIN
jgi:rare lipoprotein A